MASLEYRTFKAGGKGVCVSWKTNIEGGGCLKRGGLDSLPIQEGLGKKQGVFFFGWGGRGEVDTPMHTMHYVYQKKKYWQIKYKDF